MKTIKEWVNDEGIAPDDIRAIRDEAIDACMEITRKEAGRGVVINEEVVIHYMIRDMENLKEKK